MLWQVAVSDKVLRQEVIVEAVRGRTRGVIRRPLGCLGVLWHVGVNDLPESRNLA